MDDPKEKSRASSPEVCPENPSHPPASNHEGYGNDVNDHSQNTIQSTGDENDEEYARQFDEQSTCHTSHLKTWQASLRHLTREVLPKLDHYRNLNSIVGMSAGLRPTLDDLRSPGFKKADDNCSLLASEIEAKNYQAKKFGWVEGVLVRCLLNIWSVILFLRLSWVVGQAGILQGIGIVLAGNVVTTITSLSMSAISTNGQIKAGGTYYMISRSLGPEFGSAIGLIFSFANAVAVSMNVIGFCESLIILLATFDVKIVDGGVNDTRIIGSVTLVMLFVICVLGGMAWESRAQIFLLLILVVSMLDFLIGCFTGPLNEEQEAKGFLGLNKTIFYENLYSDYRTEGDTLHNAVSVFAVFFPACTGILAGANISGDLKDASSAIPKGTLLAILITGISYVIFILFLGATVMREATGIIPEVDDGTFLNCSSLVNSTCQYGLHNDFMVLELVSVFGPLIYAGCFAATLSSALACLVSAPKLFQALCKDRLFPYIHVFEKGYGKANEPYRAYALAFSIALCFILIGELNAIAPIISNFFMAAYCLINFSCFHASLQRSPGWRPTFKFYNMWLSLVGAILCGCVMLLMKWWTAVLTASIILILYLFVAYRKLDVNWGSSVQGQTYRVALSSVQTLDNVGDHVKTFRPQILLLSGMPSHRPPLIHFANCITKNTSLLIVAEWPATENLCFQEAALKRMVAGEWLHKEKIKGFYALSDSPVGDVAAKSLIASVGLGKLRPNILMIGFKTDWRECPINELQSYFKIIQTALDSHLGVCILRVPGKLDYSRVQEVHPTEEGVAETVLDSSFAGSVPSNSYGSMDVLNRPEIHEMKSNASFSQLSICSSTVDLESKKENQTETSNEVAKASPKKKIYQWDGGEIVSKDVVDAMLRFTVKQPKGTIDVWWLFDDGGLTLLLPHILTTRSLWADCSLRIFCLAGKRDNLESEHRKMAELMCKFRIEFSDVIMIVNINKPPKETSVKAFNQLITKFRPNKTESQEDITTNSDSNFISDEELSSAKDKTRRHIRMKELLIEHSSQASLIVMTLPMPKKDSVSAPLYQAWLETLTKDLPPFLLLRGNQMSVLTFYS